ncbi:MAG: Mov34/MPN/PAD-1 family protein [Amphiplicatus sp.]
MDATTEALFVDYARRSYPEEAGAFLVARGLRFKLHLCRNASPKPTESIVTTPEDWEAAESIGEIVGFVHSHPHGSAAPSKHDIEACRASGEAWFICGFPAGIDGPPEWSRVAGAISELPYIGRRFVHGVTDCGSMVRDYYWRELGRDIPDFYRADRWWDRGEDLYVEHFAEAGFEVVAKYPGVDVLRLARLHDVLLMNVGSARVNHAAIWRGANKILHHPYGRLSLETMLDTYHIDRTVYLLRFPDA